MSATDVSVRVATIDDVADLAQLGADTFVESFGPMYGAEDLASFLAANHTEDVYRGFVQEPKLQAWIARQHDHQAVGFATAGPCHLPVPNQPPASGELGRLYIRQGCQGGGLGARLLHAALDFLEDEFEHTYLSVFSKNTGAQRLYKRYGFIIFHEYHFMVGNHADEEFLMRRTQRIRPER